MQHPCAIHVQPTAVTAVLRVSLHTIKYLRKYLLQHRRYHNIAGASCMPCDSTRIDYIITN